ncbi:hypothetical protein L6250_02755 [Candidatus Parcubacteria bacterium]|nr:hypothetical protein [Patescibacteria group bacterium]MBU4466940.1 hypothetical protein [Patescibacteria group bacterium]MCG2688528.1 hypothetical protein [Candidatus Parcubacteria bacterium]
MKDTKTENKIKMIMRYFRNDAKIIENQNRLRNILKESFIDCKTVSFYDWECPPRQIQTEENGLKWVNFNVDLKSVVAGKKLDYYTELPKIVSKTKLIKKILDILDTSGIKYMFYMLVADTNALYLYPDSAKRIGYSCIKKLSLRFRDLLQEKADILYGRNKIRVILYTCLQDKFKREYERNFRMVYRDLNSRKNLIVPQSILKDWRKYLIGHVGLANGLEKQKEDLAKRVIASYAAEGIVFSFLDKSRIFPNPTWVNLEEPFFTGATTELLRKRQDISPFPKLYFSRK